MTAAADVRELPFPHATCLEAVPAARADEVLRWMRTSAPWRLKVASFYEQWELPVDQVTLPDGLGFLLEGAFVGGLRDRMVAPLARGTLDLLEITAHRLVQGQTIRIHNDYIDGGETHRLLIQLNEGWTDENGGMLMLFSGGAEDDVGRVVRPLHGSGFAFEISPTSFHAVSRIHGGERFTLVYSFKARSAR